MDNMRQIARITITKLAVVLVILLGYAVWVWATR